MIRKSIASLALVLIPLASLSAEPADNLRLAEMFKEDQVARTKMPIDWAKVSPMDQAHQKEAKALLLSGNVRTSNDFYRAGMIMQHGGSTEDYQLAYSLSRLSVEIDPSNKGARWLSAAAWDRILMSKKLPQWYGTQYSKPNPTASMELYKIDESVVSDEERAALNVPSLQEAKDLLLQINK